MRSFRSKPVGWRNESYRHYLAAKGISTSRRYNFKRFPVEEFTKKGDRILCPDCGGHVQDECGDWDCKNLAIVFEEDGRYRPVGQCCCYNKEHHFASKHEYFMVRTFNISHKALDVIPPEKHDAAIARMRAGEEVQDIVKDLAGIEGFTGRRKESSRNLDRRTLEEDELVTALMDIGEQKGSWPRIADVTDAGISPASWRGQSFHDMVQKAVERVEDDSESDWHLSGVRKKSVERVPLKESEEQILRRQELVMSADARAAARRREGFHKTLMVQRMELLENEKEEIIGLLSRPSPGLDAGPEYVDERRKRIEKIDEEIVKLQGAIRK